MVSTHLSQNFGQGYIKLGENGTRSAPKLYFLHDDNYDLHWQRSNDNNLILSVGNPELRSAFTLFMTQVVSAIASASQAEQDLTKLLPALFSGTKHFINRLSQVPYQEAFPDGQARFERLYQAMSGSVLDAEDDYRVYHPHYLARLVTKQGQLHSLAFQAATSTNNYNLSSAARELTQDFPAFYNKNSRIYMQPEVQDLVSK